MDVVILSALRAAIGDFGGALRDEPPTKLGAVVAAAAIRQAGITPDAVSRESNITYEREMARAIAAVDEGRAQLCCLLRAVGVEQVMHAALAGEVLPQKSTDFYPKLLSGIAIYRLAE